MVQGLTQTTRLRLVPLCVGFGEVPGPDPGDLAILAMSHQQLGHTDEANKIRSQFDEVMKDGQFKDDTDYQSFVSEVANAFTESP